MTNNLQCKAIESLKNNPYFNKYSEKIIEKQKVSPEEFVSRLEEHEKQKRNPKISNMQNETKPFSPGIPKSDRSTNISKNNLEKIMKIDLIKEKSGEEIKQIWEEFHKSKENTISATVPITSFRLIQEKSKIHPIFLLPLPRNQGYEFIMLQFTENEIHFTPLISYQMHKENAPECLTMIYFSEFADNKNIVLMKGEYDKNVIVKYAGSSVFGKSIAAFLW
ncbi:hypothetical protein PGB90_009151 [Kerria lacca]